MIRGICGYGAYIPRSRLQRSALAAAHVWFNPALKSHAKGERAIASWDEDAVTMSVEAARDCLNGRARESIATVSLASTSLPFADRQNAGIVKEALGLADTTGTCDYGGSQRAGVSALIEALTANVDGDTLCIAAENRRSRPGSEAEFINGDAAAAVLVGSDNIIARYVGSYRLSADFLDHVRAADAPFDYDWEPRWIREEGYGRLVPLAVKGLLDKTGVAAADVGALIMPVAMRGVASGVAKKVGIPADAIRDSLSATMGQAGTAQPLIDLAFELETAVTGQYIIVAGFGSGCDCLLLQRTAAELRSKPFLGVSGWLRRRRPESNYLKYLFFNGLLDLERGMRAEFDQKQPFSALWRQRRTVMALIGGKCSITGAVQFPKSEIGISGNNAAVGTQEDYPLADRPARILTHTADSLTYTPDPPAYYGMIEFEEGGRMNAEFCDIDPEDVAVGRPVRMMFRIKSIDDQRGFKKYFWKAAPLRNAA